ncbi:MAG TPA: FGGY-family carbohydrate kinase [Tepidisphaeraceae bacterium]|jgi:sugar (pentulose or hexulose) kinase
MPTFLTFDLGTTLYKVALFDDMGRMLALERVAPDIEHPEPGHWIVHPITVGKKLTEAAARLRQRVGDDWQQIAAVSFATQANSFTLLDEAQQPLMPFILWPDQRAQALAPRLDQISAIPRFRQITGMPRFGPLLGLAKLMTLPDSLRDRSDGFCYLSDWFTHALTGQLCTEAGVAGLSGAYDVRNDRWWGEALEKVGMPIEWMPRIVCAGTNLGPVTAKAAEALHLPPTCCFVVGCLDQYAGAIGTGTVEEGTICETTGTVLAAVRFSSVFEEDPGQGVFQGPAFERGNFYQMTFSSTSANLLEHYRQTLEGLPSFEQLTSEAQAAAPSDLKIMPYDGSDSIVKSFEQVMPHHTRGQVVRAIMQRVADSLTEQVMALTHDQLPTEIRSAGGASTNDYWLQLKASTLGTTVSAVGTEEPTSLGAAILAASAIGRGDIKSLAQQWVKVRRAFQPGAAKYRGTL